MKRTVLFVLLAVFVVALLRWRLGDFRTEAERKQAFCASLTRELHAIDEQMEASRRQLPDPRLPGPGVMSTAEMKRFRDLANNIKRLTRRREEVNQQIGLHHCDNK
jgi:hypothetical protein